MPECPKCGSTEAHRSRGCSGNITRYHAEITEWYRCSHCGYSFSETIEYDKTQPNDRSERALRQMEKGDLNEAETVDDMKEQILDGDANN